MWFDRELFEFFYNRPEMDELIKVFREEEKKMFEELDCIKIYVSPHVADDGKFYPSVWDVNSRVCGPKTFEELKKRIHKPLRREEVEPKREEDEPIPASVPHTAFEIDLPPTFPAFPDPAPTVTPDPPVTFGGGESGGAGAGGSFDVPSTPDPDTNQ